MVARKKKEGEGVTSRELQRQQQQHHNQHLSAEQIYQRVGRRSRGQQQQQLTGSRHLYGQLRRGRQPGNSGGGALLLCCVCEDKNSTYRQGYSLPPLFVFFKDV